MAMSLKLYFRNPNGVIQEVSVAPNNTVQELVDLICDENRLLPRGRVSVSYAGKQLAVDSEIREHNLRPSVVNSETNNIVQGTVVLDVTVHFASGPALTSNEDVTFDEFIDVTFPNHGDKEIPLNIQPMIKFKNSKSGYKIHLPSLASIDTLGTTCSGDMREYLGEEVSSGLGFVKWTETSYPFRMYLLEIDQIETVSNFKNIKYSSLTNNAGYTNGDKHSWQRYTRSKPVDSYVHVNEAENSARLLPTEALKQGALYGILLANGVPIIPVDYSSMSKPLYSYWRPGICEDLLIIFRTKKSKFLKLVGQSVNSDGGQLSTSSTPTATAADTTVIIADDPSDDNRPISPEKGPILPDSDSVS